MITFAIIPARGGSKGVPGKNIKLLGGYPLLAYAICSARLCRNIDRVVVSTDAKSIADIAIRYGAEIPFLRPAEISQDSSTDLEFIMHAIKYFAERNGKVPDLLVHLRPTTPLREPSEIDRAIQYLKRQSNATSLRSVHELAESPYKMFKLNPDGLLGGFFPDDPRPEYYNLPRQLLAKAYQPNGYVDIIKTAFVREHNSLHGPRILGFVTAQASEIDLPEDFSYLEYRLEKIQNPVYQYLLKNYPKEG